MDQLICYLKHLRILFYIQFSLICCVFWKLWKIWTSWGPLNRPSTTEPTSLKLHVQPCADLSIVMYRSTVLLKSGRKITFRFRFSMEGNTSSWSIVRYLSPITMSAKKNGPMIRSFHMPHQTIKRSVPYCFDAWIQRGFSDD